MLKDITTITNRIFLEALDHKRNLQAPKATYDLYRSLHKVIDSISLVANHYLALDMNEGFLQNSSFGEPIDKWRYFFNKDLEELNNALKKYLLNLSHIGFEDTNGSILFTYYSCKSYYSFITNEYNVGYVEPCSSTIISKTLDTNAHRDAHYIMKFTKLGIPTFDSKKALQKNLLDQKELLNKEHQKLKSYILKKYTLEDLM